MTTSVLPTVHKATESIYTEPREYWQAWIVGADLHRLPGGQLVDPPVLLPGDLPARGACWGSSAGSRSGGSTATRCAAPTATSASRAARGRPTRTSDLRKSECFVCLNCIEDCPHDALSFRFLPRKASEVAYPAVGRRAAGPGRALRAALLPDGAALGRGAQELQPGRDPAARLGRRGRVPPPLHQVRPVHPRLPDERPPARPVRGGPRGALDADHDLEDGLVRAELHAVQPGLPHRRDPRDLDRREARRRPVRGQGADQDRHGVLQPGPLPPLGDGHRAASSARRSARSAPRRSSPATSRSPTAGARRSSSSGRTSTRSSASAAASASTSAPSRTTRPSTSPPSARPATRRRSLLLSLVEGEGAGLGLRVKLGSWGNEEAELTNWARAKPGSFFPEHPSPNPIPPNPGPGSRR